MVYDEKGPVCISDYNIWFLFPPQSIKMTQIYQIMGGLKISIQAETYQCSLNNWHNLRLGYINISAK